MYLYEVIAVPRVGKEQAVIVVRNYIPYVGKISMVVLERISQIWIVKGDCHYEEGTPDDGMGYILIHAEASNKFERKGILEEVMIHEDVHAALDNGLYDNVSCVVAVKNKITYYNMSKIVHKGKISPTEKDLKKAIATVSCRIKHFTRLNLDISPYTHSNICRKKKVCEDDHKFCKIDKCMRKFRTKRARK